MLPENVTFLLRLEAIPQEKRVKFYTSEVTFFYISCGLVFASQTENMACVGDSPTYFLKICPSQQEIRVASGVSIFLCVCGPVHILLQKGSTLERRHKLLHCKWFNWSQVLKLGLDSCQLE